MGGLQPELRLWVCTFNPCNCSQEMKIAYDVETEEMLGTWEAQGTMDSCSHRGGVGNFSKGLKGSSGVRDSKTGNPYGLG